MKIIFASHNKDKQEEVKNILKDIDIVTLSDLKDYDEVIENALTLEENAFLKANYYYKKYNKPVISDDSGLFVEALDGKPGVFSARYSGENATYLSNNLKLLDELKNEENRNAIFKSVVCYIDEKGQDFYFYGEVKGTITEKMVDIKSFGYDNVFYVEEKKKTFAEMTQAEKNSLSHRRIALDNFANYLREKNWNDMIIFYANKILNSNNCKIERRLLGGMSNYTYVIENDKTLYTIRFLGEGAEKFIDRKAEEKSIKLFEKLNISNETIYFDVESGIKVCKYVDGTPLSEANCDYPYEKVSDVLKKIHQSGLVCENDYSPFERLESYQAIVNEKDLTEEYFKIKNKFLTYKEYLSKQEKVICHGDSQPSNFILTNDDLLIVDFEFTANNDPIYDIACFANKKMSDGLKLLEVYYKDLLDSDKIKRFYLWRSYQCLQWFNVASYKEDIGLSETLKIDFKALAKHYLDLASELLEFLEKNS